MVNRRKNLNFAQKLKSCTLDAFLFFLFFLLFLLFRLFHGDELLAPLVLVQENLRKTTFTNLLNFLILGQLNNQRAQERGRWIMTKKRIAITRRPSGVKSKAGRFARRRNR
jgi:hypothetical protein